MSVCGHGDCLKFWVCVYEDGGKFCEEHADDTKIHGRRFIPYDGDAEWVFEDLTLREKTRYITEYVEKYELIPLNVSLGELWYGRFRSIGKIIRMLEGCLEKVTLMQDHWWQLVVKGQEVDVFCKRVKYKIAPDSKLYDRCVSSMFLRDKIRNKCPEILGLCADDLCFRPEVGRYLLYLLEESVANGVLPAWIPEKRVMWSWFEENGFLKGWQAALKVTGVRFNGAMVLVTEYGDMEVSEPFVKKAEKVAAKVRLIVTPRVHTPQTKRPPLVRK